MAKIHRRSGDTWIGREKTPASDGTRLSGATTAEEHKNQVSDNTGDKGNQTSGRKVSEARLLYHPQRRMMQRLSDAGGRKEQ